MFQIKENPTRQLMAILKEDFQIIMKSESDTEIFEWDPKRNSLKETKTQLP